MEYSYVFRDIEICIADRRDAWICRDLTIWLSEYLSLSIDLEVLN